MNKISLIIISLAALFNSFSLSVFGQDENEFMSVSGIKGVLINRVISFGDFSSSKIKAVKVSSSFKIDGMGSEVTNMKYSFTQNSPSGSIDVKATDNPDKELINTVREFLGMDISGKASYIGTFTSPDTQWNFYINPSKGSGDRECGMIKSSTGETITVSGDNTTSMKEKMMNTLSFHYTFTYNGETVGIVTTDKKGEVWIKSDLDDQIKLALAATATSLLTRIGMNADM